MAKNLYRTSNYPFNKEWKVWHPSRKRGCRGFDLAPKHVLLEPWTPARRKNALFHHLLPTINHHKLTRMFLNTCGVSQRVHVDLKKDIWCSFPVFWGPYMCTSCVEQRGPSLIDRFSTPVTRTHPTCIIKFLGCIIDILLWIINLFTHFNFSTQNVGNILRGKNWCFHWFDLRSFLKNKIQ